MKYFPFKVSKKGIWPSKTLYCVVGLARLRNSFPLKMKALNSLEMSAPVNSDKDHNIPEEHPQHQRCGNLKILKGLNNYILFRNSASKPESYRFGVINTTQAKK